MKKIWGWILGVVLVAALGFYIVWNNSNPTSAMPPVANNTEPTTTAAGSGATTSSPLASASGSAGGNSGTGSASNGGSSGSTTGGGATATGYKSGTYTGPVTDAIYGEMQVAVTISGGKITNVAWPVYPNDPGHTTEVSAMALPQLKQETIAAQNATIDIVSGATQTSEAFQQSLAAALAQAKS